jgi:putative oxidoreductase
MDREKRLDVALLLLRAVVGIIMAAHGAQKVFGIFGGSGIEAFAGMLKDLGFTPSLVWAWITAGSELVFGFFLVLGIIPRLSAAVIAIIMAVAILKVHGPNGFFMMKGGYEYPLLILVSCMSLMLTGAGKLSVTEAIGVKS